MSGAAQSVSSRQPGVSFHELFAYTGWLAQRWFAYFDQNPRALDIQIGGRTGSVRDLALHISLAEERLLQYLFNDTSETDRKDDGSVANLRALHQQNREKLADFMSHMSESTLNEPVEVFGGRKVSKRKVLTQIYLHPIHHWAQVAMEVRQAGFPTSTPQDILITDVMD
jgi:uncharacterized damage-inducible protein DinB